MGHGTPALVDYTLFIQMGIFLLAWMVLHFLVFKPYLNLLELRRNKTTGLKEKAAMDREQAVQLQLKYDAFMKEERKKISSIVDEERRRIAEEEREIVQAARTAMSDELKALKVKVEAEYESARQQLLPQVGEFSSNIASKLVGYKLNVPAHTADISKTNRIEPTVNG